MASKTDIRKSAYSLVALITAGIIGITCTDQSRKPAKTNNSQEEAQSQETNFRDYNSQNRSLETITFNVLDLDGNGKAEGLKIVLPKKLNDYLKSFSPLNLRITGTEIDIENLKIGENGGIEICLERQMPLEELEGQIFMLYNEKGRVFIQQPIIYRSPQIKKAKL